VRSPPISYTTCALTPFVWACVGQPKTNKQHYASCVKEPYKRDDILQKRPIILRSLLIEATTCTSCVCRAAGILSTPFTCALTTFVYVRPGAFIWACVGQPKTKNSGVNFAHEGPLLSIVAAKNFVMSGGVDGVIKLWRMER